MDVRIRFGRALRSQRSKLGVSQEVFADLCGLDRTYVGGIERGERNGQPNQGCRSLSMSATGNSFLQL
jgi:transcriptional regulator with XRE-family HTH domain